MAEETGRKRLIEENTLRQLMKPFGRRLRELRQAKGWTQAEAAAKMGVQTVSVRRWELGLSAPRRPVIHQLAELYDASFDELVKLAQVPEVTQLQVRGYVAAGTPRESYEEDLGAVPCPPDVLREFPRAFALIVSGNSLNGDHILDGDLVVVNPDTALVASKLYVVRVGSEVVARHLTVEDGHVRLRASNDQYEDLLVQGVHVLGRVVYHFRKM